MKGDQSDQGEESNGYDEGDQDAQGDEALLLGAIVLIGMKYEL